MGIGDASFVLNLIIHYNSSKLKFVEKSIKFLSLKL